MRKLLLICIGIILFIMLFLCFSYLEREKVEKCERHMNNNYYAAECYTHLENPEIMLGLIIFISASVSAVFTLLINAIYYY